MSAVGSGEDMPESSHRGLMVPKVGKGWHSEAKPCGTEQCGEKEGQLLGSVSRV